MQNQKLGKGLSALLNTKISAKIENIEGDKLEFISMSLIDPNPNQPRKVFDNSNLTELSESIKINGVLQPVVLYKKNDRYVIVAGERRWRASQLANLTHIPAIVKDLSARKVAELSLIENIQREDLNAVEEAEAYARIIKNFDCTQEELANAVGKSRSYIANIVRLNELPESIKQKVRDNIISPSKARSLIGLDNAEEIAEQIAVKHLNSREVEEIKRGTKTGTSNDNARLSYRARLSGSENMSDLKKVAEMLSERFGIPVEFQEQRGGKYKMMFHLNDFEELDRILAKIS